MSARTDFSLLRSEAISRSMLGRQRLTAPPVCVDAPHDLTVARFSRTLSDRNPHVRSSTAHIVPMSDKTPRTPLVQKVIYAVCLVGAVVALMFNNYH